MSELFMNNEGESVTTAMVADYVQKNPDQMFGDYRDSIPDEFAAKILEGDFDSFYEWVHECEMHHTDYSWSDYMKGVADHFDFDSFDDMPQELQDAATDNYYVDSSDFKRTCLRNANPNIVATLYKRNGDMIEFPSWDYDAAENKRCNRYLRDTFGINGTRAEATYSGTYLRVLGHIDLYEIVKTGKVPTHITVTKEDFFIGVDHMNGSGTCGDTQATFDGKKTFRATFRVDSQIRYGVDSIFGLSGSCWQNELDVK